MLECNFVAIGGRVDEIFAFDLNEQVIDVL